MHSCPPPPHLCDLGQQTSPVRALSFLEDLGFWNLELWGRISRRRERWISPLDTHRILSDLISFLLLAPWSLG